MSAESPAKRPLAVLYAMGCRLNHAEAAKIAGALEAIGWDVLESGETPPRRAGAYVLHSCAVTAEAGREALRRVRAAVRAGVRTVVVSGCAASVAAEEFLAQGAGVVLSRRAPPLAPPLPGCTEEERLAYAVDSGQRGSSSAAPAYSSVRAPVKIQDGCSFRCSYCIVPEARGAPASRPLGEILRECEELVRRGYREIVLTGVNAAFWRDGGATLPELVRRVAGVPGLLRVRLGSVEPGTHEEELALLASRPGSKLCPFFHLPLQSGSDRVLSAMRRHYDSAAFKAAVETVLRSEPMAGLGTDVMTGFPGETEEDFGLTELLLRSLPFSNLHVFPYSERPGTPASVMPGAVPVGTRRERARRLAALGREKRAEFARAFVGRRVKVLVERVSPDGLATGWTGEYLGAAIAGMEPSSVGSLAEAVAEDASATGVLRCRLSPA